MKWYKTAKPIRLITGSLLFVFVFFPVFYVLAISFENAVITDSNGILSFIDNHISFTQYRNVLFYDVGYWIGFWNTAIFAFFINLFVVLISTLAAYGLVIVPKYIKRGLLLFYFILSLLPVQVLLVPNFIALSEFHLIGMRLSVIMVCSFSPYYVFFIYRYCKQISSEVFEAARLDGAGEFTIYRLIAFPQIRTGIFTLILIGISDFWNMIEQPLVFLQDISKMPLAITLREMETSSQYAGSIIFSIPLMILFISFIKDFQKGVEVC